MAEEFKREKKSERFYQRKAEAYQTLTENVHKARDPTISDKESDKYMQMARKAMREFAKFCYAEDPNRNGWNLQSLSDEQLDDLMDLIASNTIEKNTILNSFAGTLTKLDPSDDSLDQKVTTAFLFLDEVIEPLQKSGKQYEVQEILALPEFNNRLDVILGNFLANAIENPYQKIVEKAEKLRDLPIEKDPKNAEDKIGKSYWSRVIATGALISTGILGYLLWDKDQELADVMERKNVVASDEFYEQKELLEDTEEKLKNLLESGNASEEEIARLKAELAKLQNKNNELGKENTDLESRLTIAKNGWNDVEDKLNKKIDEFNAYRMKMDSKIAGYESTITQNKTKISKLDEEIANMKREYSSDLNKYANNLKLKEEEINKLLAENTDLQNKIAGYESDLDKIIPTEVLAAALGIEESVGSIKVRRVVLKPSNPKRSNFGVTRGELEEIKEANPFGAAELYSLKIDFSKLNETTLDYLRTKLEDRYEKDK